MEVEAEEDTGRQAIGVPKEPAAINLQAVAEQRRAARKAQGEARHRRTGDAVAEPQPGHEDHPDRRRRGEEGRIGDGRVEDGQVPEEQVAGEEHAGENTDGENGAWYSTESDFGVFVRGRRFGV